MFNLRMLLPYERCQWSTSLSEWAVRDRIARAIEPVKAWRSAFETNARPYEGVYHSGTFRMRRTVSYRTPFLPVLRGRIYREAGQTQVELRMHSHPVAALFIGLWAVIASVLTGSGVALPGALVGLYGVNLLIFHAEVRKEQSFLAQLVQAGP